VRDHTDTHRPSLPAYIFVLSRPLAPLQSGRCDLRALPAFPLERAYYYDGGDDGSDEGGDASDEGDDASDASYDDGGGFASAGAGDASEGEVVMWPEAIEEPLLFEEDEGTGLYE
jgi:hypothetical protein